MSLSEVVKTTFDSLRGQLSWLEKRTETLEKKAQKSLVQVQSQLVGAANRFERALAGVGRQFKGAVSFATRSELQTLAVKLEELTEKVEKLARGERLRASARKQEAA
jgi:hypothetical protein